MENFEASLWNNKLSAKHLFLKSVLLRGLDFVVKKYLCTCFPIQCFSNYSLLKMSILPNTIQFEYCQVEYFTLTSGVLIKPSLIPTMPTSNFFPTLQHCPTSLE